MLPKAFNDDGDLSQDYEVTFSELRESLLVLGPKPCPTGWEMEWRRLLVDNLEILVKQLWTVGCGQVYIDGSFVQDKDHPGDIDGCFACDYDDFISGKLSERLNAAAPRKVWTWDDDDRLSILGELKLPMWVFYRVELFPYSLNRLIGMGTNTGEFRALPDAFRFTKNEGRPKGILRLKRE